VFGLSPQLLALAATRGPAPQPTSSQIARRTGTPRAVCWRATIAFLTDGAEGRHAAHCILAGCLRVQRARGLPPYRRLDNSRPRSHVCTRRSPPPPPPRQRLNDSRPPSHVPKRGRRGLGAAAATRGCMDLAMPAEFGSGAWKVRKQRKIGEREERADEKRLERNSGSVAQRDSKHYRPGNHARMTRSSSWICCVPGTDTEKCTRK
jgi:hypothetical protein